MKMLLISEQELLELLRESHELRALVNGGVDNWEWYGLSREDYLEGAGKEEFEDIAREELGAYEEA